MRRFIAMRFVGTTLATLLAASCGGGGDSGPGQPMISGNPPSGTTGAAYPGFAFTVTSGGTAPFTWSERGTLPPGLSFSSTGQLSGTPVMAGTFPIYITVTDSAGLTNSIQLPLKIADSPILISAAPPPGGTVTCPYAGFTFTASGGSPGYTWTITGGALPAGLTLTPDGMLSGTPTTMGPFKFTVTATDSAQPPQPKSQPFQLTVDPSVTPPINTPVNSLGGGGAFWIPYRSTSVSSSCGQTGVFVIPSNALTTTPTYVTTSANTMVLASGQNVTVNGSNAVTAYSPATLMFAATDTDNNIHVYGLNLLSPSTPTANQISSLSLPLAPGAALDAVICDFHASSGNLLQPTTAFAVLHIAGTTGCNTTGDRWEVVHYTDSPATVPTLVSITTTDIQELYAPSGALVGLVLLDPASSKLYVYADDSFKAPANAIPGVASVGTVYSNNNVTASGTAFTGTVLFLAVTPTGGAQSLYRLSYTIPTAATSEYTAAAGGVSTLGPGVSDGTNVYFTDNGTAQFIVQESLAGGMWRKLLNNPTGIRFSLVGSNGSLLVMSDGSLATLPVDTSSTGATALGFGSNAGVFMVQTTPGTPSTALVFATTRVLSYRPSYSSTVLTPGGVVKRGGSRYSYFIYEGTSGLSGYVLQVGYYGPGPLTLSAINLETLAATALQTPAHTTFRVALSGIRVQLAGLSNFIGAGEFLGQGLAYDLSKDLVVPIVVANTNVALF
jgi:large repetitive protein